MPSAFIRLLILTCRYTSDNITDCQNGQSSLTHSSQETQTSAMRTELAVSADDRGHVSPEAQDSRHYQPLFFKR